MSEEIIRIIGAALVAAVGAGGVLATRVAHRSSRDGVPATEHEAREDSSAGWREALADARARLEAVETRLDARDAAISARDAHIGVLEAHIWQGLPPPPPAPPQPY